MKIFVRFILVLLIGLMLSCQLVLDLDLPKQPEKLVVNSVISSDCVMTVSVTKSLDILDTIYFEPVLNAQVTVSDEQGNSANFMLLANSFYYYQPIYRSNITPQPGKTYTLKISAPGFESAESTFRFPDLVENIEASTDFVPLADYRLSVQVKFKDVPDQRNYYEAYLIQKIKRSYTYYNGLGQPFTQIDTLLDRTRIYYEFTDFYDYKSLFSDIYCTAGCALDGSAQSYYGENAEVVEAKVEVLNISPDYYEYLTTSHLQGSSYDDPTSQPVQPFNNIKNGYGIFAGYSRTYFKIK